MSELGNIRIADEVIKTIAAKAASEVEGIYKLAGGVVDEVSKMLGKKRLTNGVKVEVGEKNAVLKCMLLWNMDIKFRLWHRQFKKLC